MNRSGYRNGVLIYPVSVIDHNQDEGGGIQPGVPIPPNTVDSAAIIDGNVEMEDLSDGVKAQIQKTYDEDDETLYMNFDEADVNNSNPDVGQGGGEDEDLDDENPGGEVPEPMEIEEGD